MLFLNEKLALRTNENSMHSAYFRIRFFYSLLFHELLIYACIQANLRARIRVYVVNARVNLCKVYFQDLIF